jgi:mRNA-degrading endonuclease HigB of HigAB toxin-antitoxin module
MAYMGNLTVFNIGGNKYRLITFIDYESQDESTVTKILERKQEITTKQIQKLGDFFHIAPVMFL